MAETKFCERCQTRSANTVTYCTNGDLAVYGSLGDEGHDHRMQVCTSCHKSAYFGYKQPCTHCDIPMIHPGLSADEHNTQRYCRTCIDDPWLLAWFQAHGQNTLPGWIYLAELTQENVLEDEGEPFHAYRLGHFVDKMAGNTWRVFFKNHGIKDDQAFLTLLRRALADKKREWGAAP